MKTSGYVIEPSELEFIKNFAASIGGETPWMDPLPIDFALGGERMAAFVARCGLERRREGDARALISRDPATGLAFKFTAKVYEDFPVCEWRLSFENSGTAPSQPLADVQSLALKVPEFEDKKLSLLLRGRGAFNKGPNADDFKESLLPVLNELRAGESVDFGTCGGRTSDPWMPFFNYKLPGEHGGLVFAIGWPASWKASVGSRQVRAGIARINARLLPGEAIALPSIYMLRYDGGEILRGNNLLRRFLLEKIAPRYDGEPIRLPAANGTWGGMGEAEHLERVENLKRRKLPVDVYWVDAGWYAPSCGDEFAPEWNTYVGTWRFHPATFPNGLKPISKAAAEGGIKTLLWFEPERAVEGSELPTAHPEWFLGKDLKEGKCGNCLLLNLGNEEARQWCEEYISRTVVEEGLGWYREDFNMDPLAYWRANDGPERDGITEIKAAAGLYKFWSNLRARFPELRIDNCSSGGRRLEIELLRYSVPLWPSDMQCYPNFNPLYAQTHVSGLSLWLPLFAFGTQNPAGGDTYNFRSNLAAGVVFHLAYQRRWPVSDDYPHEWLRARLDEFHAVQDCMSGDFYPLGGIEGISFSEQTWSLSQFDRPDLGRGALFAFARKEASVTAMRVRLRNLDAEAAYELHDFDSGRTWTECGGELMGKGLPVEMPEPRSSRLFSYRKI